MVLVEFIRQSSPFNIGEVAGIEEEAAKELIRKGAAVYAESVAVPVDPVIESVDPVDPVIESVDPVANDPASPPRRRRRRSPAE